MSLELAKSAPVFYFPSDRLDFLRAWSQCAGILLGLKENENSLEEAACAAFVAGDDKVAEVLRCLMQKQKQRIKSASIELEKYINESERRAYED